MKQKIQTLLNQLNHGLVERENTLKTALLTVLAGENLVLIGPPGTGKSLIARRIAESLELSSDNNAYFEYLLTKFSTPEEIFGPLSIAELKADRFKRNTDGYLPKVKMAFLDEIFKASSSILNALLTILNERIYHNGAEPQLVHMQALIAASNELPTDQEELSALYDRFLVRSFVDYVSQDNLSRLFEKPGARPELSKLTAADLDSIQREAESVTLPPDIVEAMQRIWGQHKETFKEDRRETLSDRRLKKVIKLLCFSAATNGRSQVDLSDVFLLKDCLWSHQENAIKVRDLILKTLRSFSRSVPKVEVMALSAIESRKQTYEVEEDSVTGKAPSAAAQASAKLNAMVSGFKGSGTAQDPLLIQTVEELMDLSRPDVGLKGYYFRQTADIDCSSLSSWMDISFKGHYDGRSYAIKYKNMNTTNKNMGFADIFNSMSKNVVNGILRINDDSVQLFSSVQAQSSITNLTLDNLALANVVEGSHITHCLSTVDLIKDNATDCTITGCESGSFLIQKTTTNCTITACQSGGSLIGNGATSCTITACESGSFLIRETASNCTIKDCLAVADLGSVVSFSELTFIKEGSGGIVTKLTQGSVVERCFVTGKVGNPDLAKQHFSGIADTCGSSSSIRLCALGKFEAKESHTRLSNRIAKHVLQASTLGKNISIDSNAGVDDSNGKDGKTVAAALFKQRYFEHTLGWDFDTVWQWDGTNDRPALRSVGVGATSQQAKPASKKTNMTDLLAQQMRANIWL
jgi:MoxR-like ATPase